MDTNEVGKFRFCPACGRPSKKPEYSEPEDIEEQVCTCCDRPWTACPCTPANEGECRAKKDIKKTHDSIKRIKT